MGIGRNYSGTPAHLFAKDLRKREERSLLKECLRAGKLFPREFLEKGDEMRMRGRRWDMECAFKDRDFSALQDEISYTSTPEIFIIKFPDKNGIVIGEVWIGYNDRKLQHEQKFIMPIGIRLPIREDEKIDEKGQQIEESRLAFRYDGLDRILTDESEIAFSKITNFKELDRLRYANN